MTCFASWRAALIAVIGAGAIFVYDTAFAADPVLVFAAASLKEALDDASAAYQKAEPGHVVNASYAASGTLAKQLENAAPADIFISADLKWMDYARDKKLIDPASRVDFLANTLVLVAPAANAKKVTIDKGLKLAQMVGDGKLAMGDPQSVPAGDYGKGALEKLGLWDGVKDKVAGADSVRAALALVSRGEAPFGIVYGTDASADPGVAAIGTFPEDTHPPIIYPIALVAGSHNADAPKFLAWLKTPAAAPYFTQRGFVDLAAK